jgi:D-amino-acid dehydrogenase
MDWVGSHGGPRSAVVVGAGIVGLSTAWFLQERGVEVTVIDRTGPAAGASWGNAGWVSPALTIPLNDPAVLRYGLRTLLKPNAPLHIPLTPNPGLWSFLLRFAKNCRRSSWTRAARANLGLNEQAIKAFDVLVANGVEAPITDSPITAVFRTTEDAENLLTELRHLEEIGQSIVTTALSGAALREQVPLVSSDITAGVRVEGQRYTDPGRFVQALGRSVVERGGTIRIGEVLDIQPRGSKVHLELRDGPPVAAEVAVFATGAWISTLIDRWVRVPVRAGRGYSFSVPVDRPVPCPIYLPDVRVACTPLNGKLRVAGTMEFRSPEDRIFPSRVEAIIDSVRPLLNGVRWEDREDVWVGPRPVTPDGRPLIGALPARGVYVAGGHGMWGMAHGPATGRLLAEQITTGDQPAALRDFDPIR